MIDRRYENKSTIITTNINFGEWDDIFGDPVIANAIVDRILHHAKVISISGRSYRLKDHLIKKGEQWLMNSKLIEYLNKTRNGKKTILEQFIQRRYINLLLSIRHQYGKQKCVMMCEPINASRPYCELYSVYLEEIQYYIGPYQIVDGQSLGMPYKQVLKGYKK